jgi:hypothetical protein
MSEKEKLTLARLAREFGVGKSKDDLWGGYNAEIEVLHKWFSGARD